MERILIIYDPADKEYHAELLQHLLTLKNSANTEVIESALPGVDVCEYIEQSLNEADAVLLLVSAAFLANDQIKAITEKAIAGCKVDKNITVSILIRDCYFADSIIEKGYILPLTGDFAPQQHRDRWWHGIITQLRVLLRLARLQSFLQSKESELNLVRKKNDELNEENSYLKNILNQSKNNENL